MPQAYYSPIQGEVRALPLASGMGFALFCRKDGDDPGKVASWKPYTRTHYAHRGKAQDVLDRLAARNDWLPIITPDGNAPVWCTLRTVCRHECGAKVAHDADACEPCPMGMKGRCVPITEEVTHA